MGGGVSRPVAPAQQPPETLSKYRREDAPHFTTLITEKRPISFAEKGIASQDLCPPSTLIHIFEALVEKGYGNGCALAVERPCPPLDPVTKKAPPAFDPKDLTRWTYVEYFKIAKQVAGGMCALGFQEYDSTCIFGCNAPEWNIASIATMCAHGAFTGIYPSDTAEQIYWKARLTNTSIAFAESMSASAKFIEVAEKLPYLKAIVHWNPEFPRNSSPYIRADGTEIKMLHWEELQGLGCNYQDEVKARIAAIKPSDCCDLIFTSGTTGQPKAVMISHDNVIFGCRSIFLTMSKFLDTNDIQRTLSYLPLSHIAGAMSDIFIPIVAVHDYGNLGFTWETTMARPYDLKAGSLKDRLCLVRPSIFLAVPRVWEKIHERMLEVGANVKGAKRKIADWAKHKALTFSEQRQLGGTGKIPVGYSTAAKLLAKIKQALGLDRCRMGYSGAAPLKDTTIQYFASLNIHINELYGMSECCGTTTMNTPLTHLWGSVGFALPGVEIKILRPADDDGDKPVDSSAINIECPRTKDIRAPLPEEEGEVCFRGRHIMLGYMANPELGPDHVEEIRKKNSEAIDEEGWMHSGDKGCMDFVGMIRVTGRYKELIIGAGGENIAPVPIEDAILAKCPALSNVMMVGDKRKYNIVLVTLKTVGATGELPGSNELDAAARNFVEGVTTVNQARESQEYVQKIIDVITTVNLDGSVVPSNAAKIQKFTILPLDFSISTGELTATLKLRRGIVEEKYLDAIELVYSSKDVYVPCMPS